MSLKHSKNSDQNLNDLRLFVAELGHEIKNPLGIIQLTAETLIEKINESSFDQKLTLDGLHRIQLASKRVSDIVLFMQKRALQKAETDLNQVNLTTVLTEVFQLFEEKLKKEQVIVSQNFMGKTIQVIGHPTQLGQVFSNLLSNSIDALESHSDKQIRVDVNVQDDICTINFSDSGHGIPQDLNDKIFDHLVTTKESNKGTGLGLSITKSLLEANHGKIKILSLKNPTTISVELRMFTRKT